MTCPFNPATLQAGRPSIRAVYDFNDPAASLLIAGGGKDKPPVSNPIVTGSELPTEDYDENAEDEHWEDTLEEKSNL